MEEKLIIRNFGPIKDVTLNLRKINVFIGNQGTGKSTVAKVYSVIKLSIQNFVSINNSNPELIGLSSYSLEGLFNNNLANYELGSYTEIDTYMRFELGDFYFEFINHKIFSNIESFQMLDFVNVEVYIPSYREVVVLVKDNLYALIQTETKLPQIFTKFGDMFQKAKNEIASFDYKNILGVTYNYSNGKDLVTIKNNKQIPLNLASSAVNSGIPLLVVFDYLFYKRQKEIKLSKGFVAIIEEPELNCFPETQKKFVEYFSEKIATSNNSLLITTHSPYILSSLNNLMYAYNVGTMDAGIHKNAVNEIIPIQNWVKPDDVSCYLMKDGKAFSIKDDEGLIEASTIDSVSKELNEAYDKIINIEIGMAQ